MNSKLRASVTVLTLCAIILLFISGRVWVSANFIETNAPRLVLPITGRALDPLGAGCAWALLASVLAYLVSRGLLRRVVALVMVCLSSAAVVSACNSHGSAVAGEVDALISLAVGRTVTGAIYSSNYLWLIAFIGSGLSLVISILLLVSPSGPAKRARYDRSENVAELSPWQAMDAGIDPTQD